MKDIAAVSRVKVSADGRGVVSHAGMGLLRELADLTGLSAQVTAVLTDTYRGPWVHAPGAVFADLAAAVADGADCIDGVGQLCGDREHVFGPKASTTTMWRLIDHRIDAAHLPKVRQARAAARAAAWAAGAAPPAGRPLYIDIDATLVIDHSDNKVQAAPTWKKSFGHLKGEHPYLDAIGDPAVLRRELDIRREHYNTVRLHEGIGYVTPDDEHHGRGEAIRKARRAGLAAARNTRIATRRQMRHTHPKPTSSDEDI